MEALRFFGVPMKWTKFGAEGMLRRLPAMIGIAGLTLLSGCSNDFFQAVNNSGGTTGSATYAYVTNAGGTLAEYSLTSGALAALSGSPATLPVAPTCIAMSPNNEFVYIGTADGVFLYTVNSDGTLTE